MWLGLERIGIITKLFVFGITQLGYYKASYCTSKISRFVFGLFSDNIIVIIALEEMKR